MKIGKVFVDIGGVGAVIGLRAGVAHGIRHGQLWRSGLQSHSLGRRPRSARSPDWTTRGVMTIWQDQVDWASGLGSQLTVTLNPGYTSGVDWSTGWRLPETDESKANLSGGYGWAEPVSVKVVVT